MDFWLKLLGASPDILPYARDYLQIILPGMFLLVGPSGSGKSTLVAFCWVSKSPIQEQFTTTDRT